MFIIAIIIAIFAVSIYFIYRERASSTPVVLFGKSSTQQKAELMQALSAKYEPKTLQYIDQSYGYKIRFPIGYDAIMNPFPEIHQRFAAFYPPYSMELIDVRIIPDGELSESDLSAAAAEAKTPLTREVINGNPAYLLNSQELSLIDENETIYIKQAFFGCEYANGSKYWLSLTAGISEALAPDLELVEYMIRTVEC